MTEKDRQEWCWRWAKRLYIRWHSMHGTRGWDEAWEQMGEWDQGYWYGVAEFVLDNFNEKADSSS
jgi:hypothetical protein